MRTERGTGRAAIIMAMATLMAAFLLTIAAARAAAEQKYETSVGQNTFVQGCRKTGGKPKRVASRTVRCDHGDGHSTTCNFNTNPAQCTYARTEDASAGDTHGTIGSDAGVDAGAGATPPSGTRGAAGERADQVLRERDPGA